MRISIGSQLNMLGLGATLFYATVFACGYAGTDILPQFAVTIIFFLFSGHLLRQFARQFPHKRADAKVDSSDWTLSTVILNWIATAITLVVLVLLLVKPADMTYLELLRLTSGSDTFPALALP